MMTCGAKWSYNWKQDLKIFLEPMLKCSCIFFNLFFITFHPVTLVSVDHPTLLDDGFCPWELPEGLYHSVSFKMYMYPMFPTDVLEAFT